MEARTHDIFRLDLQVLRSLAPRLDAWAIRRPAVPYWRLWWNDHTGASVVWKGRRLAIDRQHLLIVSPHTVFESHLACTIPRHLYIHFLLGGDRGHIAGRIWCITPSPLARSILKTLMDTLPDDPHTGVACPWQAAALIAEVLGELRDEDWPRPIADERVRNVLAVINRDPAAQLDNETLAELAGMSVGGLARLFARHLGMTPQDYVAHRRIEIACLLLERSGNGIDMIAQQCGYCDRSYFTTAFTRAIGMAPATYRRAVRDSRHTSHDG